MVSDSLFSENEMTTALVRLVGKLHVKRAAEDGLAVCRSRHFDLAGGPFGKSAHAVQAAMEGPFA